MNNIENRGWRAFNKSDPSKSCGPIMENLELL